VGPPAETPTETEYLTENKIMKHETCTIIICSIAAIVTGCDQTPTTTQQVEPVNTATQQAAQDLNDYTFAQRSEFAAKMQNQLAEINKDLDQLAAKIDKSSDAVKAEAKPKLQALRDQAAQLTKQLEQVNNATESTWDSVKSGTQKAFDGLKEGFQQSRQWVSDKIAP